MSLIHLIYVSTACQELETPELDHILDASVRHNAPQQITGMLLYAGGSFMQVLEGEEAAVDETLGRIVKDSRHTDLTIIERMPIASRSFSEWSMGFRRLSREDAATHPAYVPFFVNGFDAGSIGAKPGLALEILTKFASLQRP